MRATLIPAFLFMVCLLLPGQASAKAWKGMSPGKTTKTEVLAKYAKPTREAKDQGECAVTLSYRGEEKIAGAKEAQFCFDAGGKLLNIVVFPDVVLDKDTVKEAFGEDFKKKLSDEFVAYWVYERDGMVVFFDKEGKEVTAVKYLELKPAKKAAAE